MNVLDFPAEILHKILFYSILVRRVKRGLRLRLVCKRFSYAVHPALFDTRLMDSWSTRDASADYFGVGDNWPIKNQHGAEKLWHSYFVYRVQNEVDENAARLLEVRQIAQIISAETGSLLLPIIETLCWLGLPNSFPVKPKSEVCKDITRSGLSEKSNLKLNLLAAATRFNLLSLIQKLLTDGVCPASHNYLFPSATEVAVAEGNIALLEIFQESMDEGEAKAHGNWKSKSPPGVICAAARRGDMAILKLTLYPPSRAGPKTTNFMGVQYGMSKRNTIVGYVIGEAQCCTRSPKIYTYLDAFFSGPSDGFAPDNLLALHSGWGNLAMVKYFLDCGVPVDGYDNDEGLPWRVTALGAACRGLHHDVVDFLLMKGADPNFGGHLNNSRTALPLATSMGSLEMTRKLIDHSAYVNEERNVSLRIPAIWYAVATEHTALIEFLLSKGATLHGCIEGFSPGDYADGWMGKLALEMADELYLDSMAELLQHQGIKFGNWGSSGPSAPWVKWPSRNNPQKSHPFYE